MLVTDCGTVYITMEVPTSAPPLITLHLPSRSGAGKNSNISSNGDRYMLIYDHTIINFLRFAARVSVPDREEPGVTGGRGTGG